MPVAQRDAILISALCAVAIVLSVAFEAFEAVVDFTTYYEKWEIDELLTGLFVAPVGLLIYSARRAKEARQEMLLRITAEQAARHLAMHDTLTGLPNRALLADRLAEALARARRNSSQIAVFGLDLDHFKEVNDTLGHATGDALLSAVAHRLQLAVRKEDTVARLGGDEFAVVQVGLAQPASAAALADRLIDVLSEPYDLPGGHRVTCCASIGVAIAPADGNSPDMLLHAADSALYRTKSEARGTACFFEAGMDASLRVRREMTAALRTAVTDEALRLHFQPLYTLPDRVLTGFEALLRWQHPQFGLVPPSEFIALAEETGLIVPIGDWVLQQACQEAAGWTQNLTVAVNISPAQFRRGDLLGTVRRVLAQSGLPPERLELEITEGLLLQNTEAVSATLGELHDMGVRITMDDFGTGYSSLNGLRQFPFDKVKIDRSLIADVDKDPKAAAIVATVVNLCHVLNLVVTAEGIETSAQAKTIEATGCDEGQGYLLGRPASAETAQETSLKHRLAQAPHRPKNGQPSLVAQTFV